MPQYRNFRGTVHRTRLGRGKPCNDCYLRRKTAERKSDSPTLYTIYVTRTHVVLILCVLVLACSTLYSVAGSQAKEWSESGTGTVPRPTVLYGLRVQY